MIKVIVAGGRDFNDYEMLKKTLDSVLSNRLPDDVEIVSGCARGADSLGERYAEEKGLPVKQFIADWDGLWKRAGFVRNAEMAKYASHLILFWDGKSKGSKHILDLANKEGLLIKVVEY